MDARFTRISSLLTRSGSETSADQSALSGKSHHGAACEKWALTKREKRRTRSAQQKMRRACGGSLCIGNAVLCSQKKKDWNRFMAHLASLGCKHGHRPERLRCFQATEKNVTTQSENTRTAWEVEWEKNSTEDFLFSQTLLFYIKKTPHFV